MDDDRGKKSQRAESHRSERRERSVDADSWERVNRQRAQIPRQAKRSGREDQRIELVSSRGLARADDHRQQHGVQHHACAETDEVQELAHTLPAGGQYSARSCEEIKSLSMATSAR